ncbi:hypothetical protein ACIGEZ_19795 [Streptomyces sp. NPDC085481]|uniref:hypothetical protein n=1 Tax=Streptomyces sp. NPDC085481 TaxID=3365727 RepID=UPI0037D64EE9
MEATVLAKIGAGLFGFVIGWITYRTLRRRTGPALLSDISTVIGAVGGAAVAALPFDDPDMFGVYAIGLGAGFFAYLGIAFAVPSKNTGDQDKEPPGWMG